MHHPFLIGKSIYLRALEEKDLDGPYFQWFNDMEVCRYNSHARFPNSSPKMRSFFESTLHSKENVVLAISDKKTNLHIGNVSLQNIDWITRSAEFAIIIGDKKFWSKGIGTQVGQLIIEYAVKRLNLRRIYCGTHEDNISMQKMALALGMKEEGRRKEAIFKDGKYKDIVEYGGCYE